MKYNKQHLKYGSYEEIIASFNDPINGRALSCAHRSYWRMYPENSVPAILAAIDYGCDIVELDVRATKDGVCVLSHDRNLGRCTNATGELAKMNVDEIEYDKIKDLKLKFATGGSSAMTSDEVICRFDDCIKLCEGKIMINLDKVMENKELTQGVNVLNGEQALIYARIRKFDSDFGRTNRQRKVMSALIDSLRGSSIKELAPIISDILPMLTTDLSRGQLLLYAVEILPHLSQMEILSQSIPAAGTFTDQTIDGMAVLEADMEAQRQYLQNTLLK